MNLISASSARVHDLLTVQSWSKIEASLVWFPSYAMVPMSNPFINARLLTSGSSEVRG